MESRLDHLEAVQATLLEIGQLSASCSDITDFLGAVHRALGRIMYAANFYVALGDREDGTVRFVYFVDAVDAAPDPNVKVTLALPEQSPTAWVMPNRRTLVMTADEHNARALTAMAGAWAAPPSTGWAARCSTSSTRRWARS